MAAQHPAGTVPQEPQRGAPREHHPTKLALAASLRELMRTRPFEKISVMDVCAYCGVNRKSFYYHFRDKYDLVNWIFDVNFLERLDLSETRNSWDLLRESCGILYEDRVFYRKALGIRGQNSFRDHVLETMRPVALGLVKSIYHDEVVAGFFFDFFGDAFLNSIMRWFDQEDGVTPEIFVRDLREACLELARRILDTERRTSGAAEGTDA